MRFGFITPSLRSAVEGWQAASAERQALKLSIPALCGYLHGLGHEDLRQYDFEHEVLDLERSEPGRLRLALFFDQARVDAFLAGGEPEVRGLIARVLDALAVEPADLFGVTCAVVPRPDEEAFRATVNLALCLATALKERFPGCRTVIGGMPMRGSREHRRSLFRGFLERCAALDFAVVGPGEAALGAIVAHLAEGAPLEVRGVDVERCGGGWLLDACDVPDGAMRPVKVPGPAGAPPLEEQPVAPGTVTPWFDRRLTLRHTCRGAELAQRYPFSEPSRRLLAPHAGRELLVLPMHFLKGCRGRCAFCGYSTSHVQARRPADVVRSLAWLREQHGARAFHFLNTNLNADPAWAAELCAALAAQLPGIVWSDSVRVNALDERLLEQLRAAGAVRLVVGVECPSDHLLDFVHKGVTMEQVRARLRRAHELGLWLHVQLIAGLPGQTVQDLDDFVRFVRESAEHVDSFGISRYYLDPQSLMARSPGRYGLRVLPSSPDGGEQAFDETQGLAWPDKQRQIRESAARLEQAIHESGGTLAGVPDLDLLFFLYDAFGHGAKAQIRRLFREATGSRRGGRGPHEQARGEGGGGARDEAWWRVTEQTVLRCGEVLTRAAGWRLRSSAPAADGMRLVLQRAATELQLHVLPAQAPGDPRFVVGGPGRTPPATAEAQEAAAVLRRLLDEAWERRAAEGPKPA